MNYEIRQYTDDEGKLVTARIPVFISNSLLFDAKTLAPDITKTKYFGTYTIPHPSGAGMRIEFEFPENFLIDQCFSEFKPQAEAHFRKLHEESQKETNGPKLWTPGEGGKSGLIVPR